MPVITIDDLDDPRVAVFRDVKAQNSRRNGELFVVEGRRTVERLLASRFATEAVLLSERKQREWLPLLPPDLAVYVLPQSLAAELVGFNFHVGVMAAGRRQPSPTLDEWLAAWPRRGDSSGSMPHVDSSPDRPLTIVVCPSCDNPENLGAILRITAALGGDGVLLGDRCCDPFSRRVVRVSMGAALQLPICESQDLLRDLRRLRVEWGVELLATALAAEAIPLEACQRGPRIALLLGNEAEGLSAEYLAAADRCLTIPMAPQTDSLNVAVAAGIFLYHLRPASDRRLPSP